jgi:S1-C subfamily serine protease
MKNIVSRLGFRFVAFVTAASILGFLLGSAYSARTSAAPQQSTKAKSAVPAAVGSISWQDGFAPVAGRDLPAVVNISSSKTVRSQMMPFLDDPFFQQFFGRQFQVPREQRGRHRYANSMCRIQNALKGRDSSSRTKENTESAEIGKGRQEL